MGAEPGSTASSSAYRASCTRGTGQQMKHCRMVPRLWRSRMDNVPSRRL